MQIMVELETLQSAPLIILILSIFLAFYCKKNKQTISSGAFLWDDPDQDQ